jgi:hypothetical protein
MSERKSGDPAQVDVRSFSLALCVFGWVAVLVYYFSRRKKTLK